MVGRTISRTGEGFVQARDYFQQSIDKDPAYALAYAGLADAYAQLAFFNVAPPRETMPKAKAAAIKALEIDGQLGEAYCRWDMLRTLTISIGERRGRISTRPLRSTKPTRERTHFILCI